MTEIRLSSEQNTAVRTSEGEVVVRDLEGKVLGVLDVSEYLQREKNRPDARPKEKGVSSAKAREYLAKLQSHIDEHGEMPNEQAVALVRSFKDADAKS